MRLDELKGIKSYQYATGSQLMMRLTSTGVFKKALGRGSFAIAFELSNGEVLKTWANDEAYEKYLEYVGKHASNPYLIKTLGKIQNYKMKHVSDGTPQEMKYIRLEKLKMLDSLIPFGYQEKNKSTSEKILDKLITVIYKYKTRKGCPANDKLFIELGIDEKKSSDKFLNFIDAAFEICTAMVSLGLTLDIGLSNFGMRDEQVVFLDPVVGAKEKSIKLNDVLKV